MNELVIPPAPLWYKTSVLVCAPDNTLVYGHKNQIVVIKEKSASEPAEVKLIEDAHCKNITSISLNKKWKDPNSYAVSASEDNIVKVWNMETLEKKTSNKDLAGHKQPVIGAVFGGEDRVVSATQDGFVTIWNFNTNESKSLKDLFKSKVSLTCLSSCPHASWLLAFGQNNGGVVVADLRRNGKVLYNLRGHYQAVVSLSWCPAPVNVFPRHTQNIVKNKSRDCSVDTKNNDKCNPWANLVHADDEAPMPASDSEQVEDFLIECNALKSKILGETLNTKSVSNNRDISPQDKEKQAQEVVIHEPAPQVRIEGRELPRVFDVSGDFLDDSVDEINVSVKEIANDDKIESNDTNTNSELCKTDEKCEDSNEMDETKNKAEETNPELTKTDEISESAYKSEDSTETMNETKQKAEESSPELTKTYEYSESDYKNEDSAGHEEEDADNSVIVADAVEEEPRIEYLLASSGKDKSVYIWRAGSDGRMQTFFHLPKRSNRRSKSHSDWISLCWVSPQLILTSSTSGQLLAWPLPKPKASSKQYNVVHEEHTFPIFNIAATQVYNTEYNWRDEVDLKLWTWGVEGKLINYDLTSEKINISYSTITASITCFDSSSLDPNRVAIGLRNGGIRVWDLSLQHTKVITMQKYQQKCTHRVSAIAWHPVKEMLLAFGTEEGRVGLLELIPNKSTLFPHYFHNQVYKVEWGPITGDANNLGIYVVAEGKIAVYDTQKPNQDPVHLEVADKFHVYKFAWKPDFSLLLLNGKDGSLIVLRRDLSAITTLYPNEKGLNAIVWHPDAVTCNLESSKRCNWFAVSTSKGLLVYDCASIENNDNFAENVVVKFEGHLKPTLDLVWCPFEGDRIVSVAADGLAHVWDVGTKQLISTFIEQYLSHYPVVLWSPIDPDLIILGDRFITVWSISKNPPRNDEEFVNERKRLVVKASKSDGDKPDKITIEISKPKPGKISIVPALYVSNDENISAQIENMKKLMSNEDAKNDPLNLFGSKEQVHQLLDANYKKNKADGKHKSCELISLWKGNVSDCIQSAIDENRVTSSIIALAPMISPKLWQDACESYAKKLLEDANSDPLETATYFLACHKIEDAINCLCLNSMFKEALALAKHRLPQESDVIVKVTEKWAEYCVNTGNFENAAYCYISINDYENAAKVLARRNQDEFLEFAVELAEKAGNKALGDSIKFKREEESVKKSDVVEILPSRFDAVVKKEVELNGEVKEAIGAEE